MHLETGSRMRERVDRGAGGAFPGGPVAKMLPLQCRGTRVRSLVRELRFHSATTKSSMLGPNAAK